MNVFLRVVAGLAGCVAMVAVVIGVRDVVSGLQAGSAMTPGGLAVVGVATVCTAVVIVAAWHVAMNGRQGVQRIDALISGTVLGQAAGGAFGVAAAISAGRNLMSEGLWLALVVPALIAVAGLPALRSAARQYRNARRERAVGLVRPEIEILP